MPGLVKCDVCERVFNARYLASHKRMAHGIGERKTPTVKPQEAIRTIVALYKELSADNREKVLERLAELEK
jgi:mannose/fructose-specific phosphotransferase system component IIA